MVTALLVILVMGRLRVWVYIDGLMGKTTKESGRMELKKVKEFGTVE